MRRRLLALAAAALVAAAGSCALIYVLGVHRVLEIPTDWPWDGHADLAAQGALALLACAALLLVTLIVGCWRCVRHGATRSRSARATGL